MTDQREELERIINSPNFDLMFKNDKIVKDLAQTILDAGYVKKDSIELDEEKIFDILNSKGMRYVGMPEETRTYSWNEIRDLSRTLYTAHQERREG